MMEMKNATNSNENQEFILIDQNLVILNDQNLYGDFCLETNTYQNETIAKYCEHSLEYICKEKKCVRKCCPIYHVSISYLNPKFKKLFKYRGIYHRLQK